MVRYIVSCWWYSVAQATAAELLEVVVLSWFVEVVFRWGKSDKAMLGESVLMDCVSGRSILNIRGHRGFKVIIDGFYGVFVIEE